MSEQKWSLCGGTSKPATCSAETFEAILDSIVCFRVTKLIIFELYTCEYE